jgi:hypothetical protein
LLTLLALAFASLLFKKILIQFLKTQYTIKLQFPLVDEPIVDILFFAHF